MDKIFKKCTIKNFDFDFKNQPWSSHKDITVSHTINKETYHYQIFINVALVKNIGLNIGIDVKTASIILQPPGHTIHLHEDKFFKLKNEYPYALVDQIVRANIFLEDWKKFYKNISPILEHNFKVNTEVRPKTSYETFKEYING